MVETYRMNEKGLIKKYGDEIRRISIAGWCFQSQQAGLEQALSQFAAEVRKPLLEDSKRLDWLEQALWNHPDSGNGLALFPFTKNATNEERVNIQGLGDEDGSNLGEEISEGATLRECIDAALAQIKE